jgi:hypothetical protein
MGSSLLELVKAFDTLNKAEKKIRWKETFRFGGRLVDYLLELEKKEQEDALG